jgi:hypothetical protein
LVALTLALGDKAYLYGFLQEIFPPFGLMRFPVKFVMLLTVTLPLLGALGMAALASADVRGKCPLRQRILSIGLIFLALIGLLVWFERCYPITAGEQFWSISAPNGIARAGFLLGGVSMLVLLLRFAKLKLGLLCAVLFLSLLWLDLILHTPRQNPTVACSVYQPGFAPLQQLNPKPAIGLSRAAITPACDKKFDQAWIPDPFQNVLLSRLGMIGNANILDDIPKVRGFYALSLRETSEVERALFLSLNRCRTNIADFLSISQLNELTLDPNPELENEPENGKPFGWAARSTHLPFVTAGMLPVYQDQTNALEFMCSISFNPRKVTVVSQNPEEAFPTTSSPDAEVLLNGFAAHRVAFKAQSSTPALAVVAQSIYPAWRAYVDGKPVPLMRANHAFQALRLDPGTHQVLIRYEDRLFQLGLLISVVTLAGGALVCRLT